MKGMDSDYGDEGEGVHVGKPTRSQTAEGITMQGMEDILELQKQLAEYERFIRGHMARASTILDDKELNKVFADYGARAYQLALQARLVQMRDPLNAEFILEDILDAEHLDG